MTALTAFDFDRAVLMVEWIIMQIHHASQSGGESKSVLDTAVSVQSHQSVSFGHVVQKTEFFVIRQEEEI